MPNILESEQVFKRNDKGHLIQSLLLPVTMNRARGEEWLEKHGFQHKRFHRTANYRRYRQFNPPTDSYPAYRMEHLRDGILAVIMYPVSSCK